MGASWGGSRKPWAASAIRRAWAWESERTAPNLAVPADSRRGVLLGDDLCPPSALALVAGARVTHNHRMRIRGGRSIGAVVTAGVSGAAVLGLALASTNASAASPPRPAALAGAGVAAGVGVDTATITASLLNGFSPQTVDLNPGGTLSVQNTDIVTHTFTSDAVDAQGDPLFDVTIGPGQTKTITAVSSLGDGTYGYHCAIHPQMTGTLVVGTGGPVPTNVPAFEQPLVQPPRLHGRHIRIVMRKARVRVLPHGPRTPMWTYGGTFPGPTIVRTTGHPTHVTFVNRLPRSAGAVTVHQHGGHQASADDGQPTRFLIRHGQSRTYDFPLTDAGQPLPAALRFYHDHRMGRTARNNWFGLQGLFLTTDPHDAQIGLPHGRYDLPLMFTDRTFRADNSLRNPFRHPMSMPGMGPASGTVGSKILVNGRFAPYRWVRPGLYRLQILNASLFSSYDFALSDGRPLVQIGTGSGLLPHAVIAPGHPPRTRAARRRGRRLPGRGGHGGPALVDQAERRVHDRDRQA